jgi:dienelactone hydrolase
MSKDITKTKNFIIGYNHQKPIVADLTYVESENPQPVVIFCHGYKGYKDWGAWHLVAKAFAQAGMVFLKFNFSHNGGTFENPIDFPDLEAFGQDNFSKQMSDLQQVIDFVIDNKSPLPNIDTKNISLIGHSRGGGIACLMSSENKSIKKLLTWAAVSDFKSRFPSGKKLADWKKDGIYYVKNSRTKQNMPHYFQFYEDFEKHEERFDIKSSVERLNIPFLIIHGKEDETVNLDNALLLKDAQPEADLKIIENATHTFNTAHPWKKDKLSPELHEAVQLSLKFIQET